MRHFVDWLLGLSPYPELWIRRMYYSNDFFKKLKSIKDKKEYKQSEVPPDLFEKIVKYIKALGIEKGDILIVHSSMDALSPTGATPKQYIDMLLELVGEQGTLVIPAYPLYKGRKTSVETQNNQDISVYNPRKTICSTGLLPNLFMRYPGVLRSEFPENSLAAKGPHAKDMMLHNLESELAHGKNSSWEYCVEHHAKILLLGVKSNHSTTAVHVAEDLMDFDWPVNNWYEQKQYIVKRMQDEIIVKVRIRRQYWSRYVVSYYRSRMLINNHLLQEEEVGGINIGFIPDSKKLVDYLITSAMKGKLFFHVPKKYWKSVEK